MQYLQNVLDSTSLFPRDMLPDMVAPFLAGEAAVVWRVARLNSVAQGFCFAEQEAVTDATWNLRAIAVATEIQGKGLGASLLKSCEDSLRSLGARILIVDTSGMETYAPARRFYHRNGYEEAARLKSFWADGDDKVTFLKER